MKDLIKSMMIIVSIFHVQNCFAESVEKRIHQDIVSMLGSGPENSPVQVETDGIYVDSKVCRNSPSPLTVLLKDRLKIQQDQVLIGLFQQILCTPRNDQLDIDLTPFSANLYESIPVEMVMYSRQQELGRWLLDDNEFSVAFPSIDKNQMKINLMGLNPDSSILTTDNRYTSVSFILYNAITITRFASPSFTPGIPKLIGISVST